MDVTIAVGTYGDSRWQQLATTRAIPSARALGVPVIHAHAHTLRAARNAALAEVRTEWVIHLDADDELEAGYIDVMAGGSADVRAPAVRYVSERTIQRPAMPTVAGHNHGCIADCLRQGNWLVVGACVRTDLVRRVGGWRDFAWSEDWDLWLRCYLAGASIEPRPGAIYRAHVRSWSRNRSVPRAQRLAVHRQIEAANGLGPGGVPR